jgi:hypothetical protein
MTDTLSQKIYREVANDAKHQILRVYTGEEAIVKLTSIYATIPALTQYILQERADAIFFTFCHRDICIHEYIWKFIIGSNYDNECVIGERIHHDKWDSYRAQYNL